MQPQSAPTKVWYKQPKYLIIAAVLLVVALVLLVATTMGGSDSSKSADKKQSSSNQQAESGIINTYSGSGNKVVDIDKKTDGPVIVDFDCSSCPDGVSTIVDPVGRETSIANVLGSYKGSRIIDRLGSNNNTKQIEVNLDGDWKMTLRKLDSATTLNKEISGTGETVFKISKPTTLRITFVGEPADTITSFNVDFYTQDGSVASVGSDDFYQANPGDEKTFTVEEPGYLQLTGPKAQWKITPQ
jgi:thiol-disulfide isomerase/thioredoxin